MSMVSTRQEKMAKLLSCQQCQIKIISRLYMLIVVSHGQFTQTKISSINFCSSQWLMQQLDGPNLALSSTTLQKLLPSVSMNIGFVTIHNPEKLFMTMALNFLGTAFKNFLIAMALKDSPKCKTPQAN